MITYLEILNGSVCNYNSDGKICDYIDGKLP